MRFFKRVLTALLFLLSASSAKAGTPPFDITFFGLYGSPYFPSSLAASTKDGVGFNILGEWNASPNASLGLGFERTTFYSVPTGFTAAMLNLEGRVFPLENGKGDFSPYVMGGAGLNLTNVGGPVQLKAALGSRITIVSPVFLDFAVGSHWVQAPNAFQYIDGRFGLSFSFDISGTSDYGSSSAKPSVKPAATAMVSPTPAGSASPTPQPLVSPTPTETFDTIIVPTPTQAVAELNLGVESGPVSAVQAIKNYYRLGMKSFLKRDYTKSKSYLLKSLAVKEAHVASYYYAETYATLGVIYHFHTKGPNHKALALKYYKMALKIDPTTKSAKKFIKLLQSPAKPKHKAKPKPTPTPSDDGAQAASAPAATPVADTAPLSMDSMAAPTAIPTPASN